MINALSGKVSAASMFSATKRENIFFVRREAFPVAFVDERRGLIPFALWTVLLTGNVFYITYKIFKAFQYLARSVAFHER